jgi:hypothetical protein
MKLRSFVSTALLASLALGVLGSGASIAGCTSKSEGSTNGDGSVCPAAMPKEGDSCTVPLDTRCTFGDACSGAAFVCGKSATWERGAFTSRCDGG